MNEITRHESTALTKERFEEQQRLFISKGLRPEMVFSHELVPLEDGKMMLKKRADPLDTIDFDLDGIPYEIRKSAMKTGSELTGFAEAREGAKYPGDAMRFLDTEHSSLEVGEIEEPWEVH